jgi:hypothetical protein
MAQAEKIDLYKKFKAEYITPKQPTLVEVGPAHYLAVTGQGAPGGEEFTAKIGALYAMAFTIKMTRKFAGKGDYVICKLEGQYWSDDEDQEFQASAPDDLRWRLMIRTPDFIAQDDLDEAAEKLLAKGKAPEAKAVVLVSFAEGTCVQVLHVGPYDQEGESVARMQAFVAEQGLQVAGRHHEIYLSDPRRVAPEKLRTILRLPVRKA